jgi:hypothetical protein
MSTETPTVKNMIKDWKAILCCIIGVKFKKVVLIACGIGQTTRLRKTSDTRNWIWLFYYGIFLLATMFGACQHME